MNLLNPGIKENYWPGFKAIYCKELLEKEYQLELQKRAQQMTDRLYGFTPIPDIYYKDRKDLL